MSRDLTAGMKTALEAGVVRPCLCGRLDIATDPVVAWTGPGTFAPSGTADAALNGQSFSPIEPFIDLSAIKEDQGIGGPVIITLSGHDLDETLLQQVVKDKRLWRGKDAWLWLALLDSTEAAVIDDPVRIKTGVIVGMSIHRTKDSSTVRVTIDEDLGNAKASPFRWLDHPRLFSSDTFGTWVTKLANKPRGFEKTDIGTSFVGSVGGGFGGFRF